MGKYNRREFLHNCFLGAVALIGANALGATESKRDTQDSQTLPKLTLGGKLEVSALGLGCMGMSHGHGPARDIKEMTRLLHRAVDLGVRYFDTAEIYGPHTNEELLGIALKPYRHKVAIGTKFGLYYPLNKQMQDSSKKAILRAVDGSLKRLKSDYIDLYTQHRVDTDTPIEEVAETMKELVKIGKIRHYGLSEASANTLERAHRVFPVCALQSHYSMMFREVESNGVLETCRRLGIGFVAYSPLERGFLAGGMNKSTKFHPTLDMRANFPRFSKEALEANQVVIEFLREVAKDKFVRENGRKVRASLAQVALAWLLAQRDFIMPIPETTNLAHLEENLKAIQIRFTKDELDSINARLAAIRITGERYPPNSDMAKSVGL